MEVGRTPSVRSMVRRWRRSFCRCRIIVCRFFSGERWMFLPQRTQRTQRNGRDFGLRISDCGLNRRFALCVLCVLCGKSLIVLNDVVAAPEDVVPVEGTSFRGELISI